MRTLAEIGAIDLAPEATKRRFDDLMRPLRGLGGEMQRVLRLLPSEGSAVRRELQRSEHLAQSLGAAADHELGHLRDLPTSLPTPPSLAQLTMQFAEDPVLPPSMLGLDRRPLGESDDPEYRTDPDDTRPVKSLWQRLQRRLFP